MIRKLYVESFIFFIAAGILIVLNSKFLSGTFPKLNIAINLLICILIFYAAIRLLKSKFISYSMFRLLLFVFFISIPLLPIITNGYSAHVKNSKSADEAHKDNKPVKTMVTPEIIIQEKTGTNKIFYNIIYGNIKKLEKLKNFTQNSEIFFNEHFPLREKIVKTYNYYAVKYLRKSSNDKVIIGKDGWLFYKGDDGKQTIDDYTGKRRYSDTELEKIRTNLEKYNSEFSRKNIQFIVVVAPNKESIYSEYLPDFYLKDKGSKLEQIKKYLTGRSSKIKIIDLKGVLLNQKKNVNSKFPLYFITDTHWNDSGSYLAYRFLMEQFKIVPVEKENFDQNAFIFSGDIVRTMLNCDGKITENSVLYKPKIKRSAKRIDKDDKDFVTIIKDSNLPKAVIFRDSFGWGLQPYLSEHFSRIRWISKHKIDAGLIEDEKPDFVIVELVERYLDSLLTL